eukprot:346815-Pleurochrysis_carterae.AAC.2
MDDADRMTRAVVEAACSAERTAARLICVASITRSSISCKQPCLPAAPVLRFAFAAPAWLARACC